MLINESNLRKLIRKKLYEFKLGKISNKTSSSSSSSGSSGEGELDTDINFNFTQIPTPEFAKKAKKELSDWGGAKESDPKVLEKLKAYWGSIKSVNWVMGDKGQANHNWTPTSVPWSAAFITYVTGNDSFFDSAAHEDWKNKAVANTSAINKDPENYKGKVLYVALDAKKYKPVIGDNVWKPRDGGTHSDIVISDSKAVGGNLSDTVKETDIDHPIVIKKVKILGKK